MLIVIAFEVTHLIRAWFASQNGQNVLDFLQNYTGKNTIHRQSTNMLEIINLTFFLPRDVQIYNIGTLYTQMIIAIVFITENLAPNSGQSGGATQ